MNNASYNKTDGKYLILLVRVSNKLIYSSQGKLNFKYTHTYAYPGRRVGEATNGIATSAAA